jgi:hypothetical protein
VIDDKIKYEKVDDKKITTVDIEITNFTPKQRNITIYCKVPVEAEIGETDPKPFKREEGLLIWKVSKMTPTERRHIIFKLVGLDKGDYEETDLFFEGLRPENVIGAEPL